MKITALIAILLSSLLACQSTPESTPGGQASQIDDEGPRQTEDAVDDEREKRWWEPDVSYEDRAIAAKEKEEEEEMDADRLALLIDDPDLIALGENLYARRCAACHGLEGEGGIASPLTDGQWEFGTEPIDIYQATWEGLLASGMPSHSHMEPDEVAATVAYMLHEFDPNYP